MSILSVLSVRTSFQLRHWRNSEAVFSHALEVTKDNYMAHFCLATPLQAQGKVDEAVKHYTEALRIEPGLRGAQEYLKEIRTRQYRRNKNNWFNIKPSLKTPSD